MIKKFDRVSLINRIEVLEDNNVQLVMKNAKLEKRLEELEKNIYHLSQDMGKLETTNSNW